MPLGGYCSVKEKLKQLPLALKIWRKQISGKLGRLELVGVFVSHASVSQEDLAEALPLMNKFVEEVILDSEY